GRWQAPRGGGGGGRAGPPPGGGGERLPAPAGPAATRLFLTGNAVAMTGNGLVLAFTLIYLHQARGIALPVVGLLLAAGAAAGILAVTVSGVLLDRLGARPLLPAIILRQAAPPGPLPPARHAPTAPPPLLPARPPADP